MTKARKLSEIENELRTKAEQRGYTPEHVEEYVRRTLEKIKRTKQQSGTRQEP